MSLAKKLNENPAVSYVLAAIVLAAALYLILGARGESGTLSKKWMYNLNTGRLVKGDTDWTAPYSDGSENYDYGSLGSGGALVDATVFSCGDPAAIEEGMTPQDLQTVDAVLAFVSRQLDAVAPPSPGADNNYSAADLQQYTGTLVAAPGSNKWVPEFSGPGMKLRLAGTSSCGEGQRAALTVPIQ